MEIFGLRVAKVRSEVNDILKDETASGQFLCSDDGIDVRYQAEMWKASIWRRSDAKNMIEIECRRGVGAAWQVLVAPTNHVDPMFVLRWPDPDFDATLRTALESLKT